MESNVTAAIRLSKRLRIGTKRGLERGDNTPGWASFMVTLGWWLSNAAIDNGTLHCVTVVPRRECCSSLIALGAQFASAQQRFNELTWAEFVRLPTDSRVFFKMMNGNKMNSYAGVLVNDAGETPREIHVRDEPIKIWVNPRNFSNYKFRSTPYLTGRQWRISRNAPFFKELIANFDTQWWLSNSRTCLVVTVVARWFREVEGLLVAAGEHEPGSSCTQHLLKDVLMVSSQGPAPGVKTLLHSPVGVSPKGGRCHLAVIDGPAALRSISWVKARTFLILLSQAEHDEWISDELVGMTCRRDDTIAGDVPPLPAPLPPGVDLIVFATPGQGR
jgi:hypothetical protein